MWRIIDAEFAADPLGTEGARRFSGRYHSAGHEVLYTAETESLARLERLVHLRDEGDIPMLLLEIGLPDGAAVVSVESLAKSGNLALDDLRATRAAGDAWYEHGTSLALSVPSVLSISERNVLLARRAPQFARLKLLHQWPIVLDPRLRARASATRKGKR